MRCCDCEFRKDCSSANTNESCFSRCLIREDKFRQKGAETSLEILAALKDIRTDLQAVYRKIGK